MLLFLNMGGGEMFVIIFFVLIFFGTKNMPEMARGLGKGMREVKDAMSGIQSEIQREMNTMEGGIKTHLDDINTQIDAVKKDVVDVNVQQHLTEIQTEVISVKREVSQIGVVKPVEEEKNVSSEIKKEAGESTNLEHSS